MKKLCVTFLILLFGTLSAISQNSFEFGIDSKDDCLIYDADIDTNGNVIIVGEIGPFVGFDFDAFIMKLELDGSYSTKRFDLMDTLSMFSTVDVLDNGDFFVIGSYTVGSNFNEREYLWIVILDQELNLVIEKSYKIREPYVGFGTSFCSIIDNAGNIIYTGSSLSENDKDKTLFSDFAFYKFNQQGDTLLSKYYSYIWNEWSWELRQMPNSDNLMLIEKSSYYNNHNELMFLDPELNIINVNQTGDEEVGMRGGLSSEYWVTDTSFLLSGGNYWDTAQYSEYYIGVYLVDTSAVFHQELALNKTDTSDYQAWRNSMAYANDSTIYIGGFQSPPYIWVTDPTIVELYVIDKDMNLLGYKEFGGDASYEVWGIIATDDDGCLMYGTSYTNDTVPERDAHIWKVLRDDINIITEVSQSEDTPGSISVYPNPVIGQLYIHLDKKHDWDKLSLSIFTIEGKKVFKKNIIGKGNLLKADLHNLEDGLFVIRISNENKIIYSKKIIKK